MTELAEMVKVIDTLDLEVKPVPEEKSRKALIAPEGGSFESIIIGGGPAGMTAGIYLARKLIKTLLISPYLGGQVSFTSNVENYPGYNVISGIELAKAFEEQLQLHSIYLRLSDSVNTLDLTEKGGTVTTEKGARYSFATLIAASGKRVRGLGIPGEKEFIGRGVTYCATCDAPLYRGETVAVIGGGNSAFSAAIDLLALGCTVYLVNCEPGIQADGILVERTRASHLITMYANHSVESISGNQTVSSITIRDQATGEIRTIPVSGVFVEIGLVPNSQFAKGILSMNEKNEILVDCYCKTSVPGIFAAGDVTNVPEKQIIIAAGEGAKAALGVSNYLLLKKK
ncbi:MAG: FAD-dependent oxidoreductase [Candidatus Latescibacter sp.]|nr:FAD-dependent oxidoreductase [Candidatus Latescibacter sp.]